MGVKRTASEARGYGRQERDAKPSQGSEKQKQSSEKLKLKITPRADWHTNDLPEVLPATSKADIPFHIVDKFQQYATSLLETEGKAYSASNESKSSSQKFASTIMSAGTLEDKISALTLLVQESPLHGMRPLENLIGLAGKRSRNQALMAAAAIKDLLSQGSVLPDRKLKTFSKQPGLVAALQGNGQSWAIGRPLPNGLTESHLIVWAFEDWLKKQYFEFLKVLETWCSDEVDYARSRAITYVWELLKDKPEQEENLLRLLVNKLGDTDRKIASRTSYLLLQLQVTHPAMKRIVIDAIENECLFRPSQSMHAKYYSIITLNQTILGKGDQETASQLLRIYFSLFVQLLRPSEAAKHNILKGPQKQQGGGGKAGKAAAKKAKAKAREDEAAIELSEKMTAQVLTGVNRAFPFADTGSTDFAEQIDTIFRITHSSNFNTSIQALMLLQKLTSRKHHGVDRYYRTLYESLLDPRLIHSSKQIMYLNLLYKSLKSDVNIKRVQAFVKRLLQVMNLHEVPFICGVLYLISELQTTFPGIRSMIKDPELDPEDEEEHFVDAPENADDLPNGQVNGVSKSRDSKQSYDPKKRDPEHSNAERSALWDILPLVAHFHPSVSLFAECLVQNKAMPPKPDPSSHGLMHFLDRFIYRNAKAKQSAPRGTSIMQPLIGSAAADLLIKTSDATGALEPVNTDAFWNKNIKDVPVDQVFFHSYFNQVNKGRTTSKKKKAKTADAEGSDDDGSGEEEIWKALVDSRPEIEADDDEDDLSMGDLEDYSGSELSVDDAGSQADGDEGVQIADFPDEMDEEMDGAEDDASDGGDFDFDDEDDLMDDDEDLNSDLDVPVVEKKPEESKGKETNADKRKKRRKLKHLPTFASVDDYAKLLQDEPDDY
ncbi:putative ribosome biogenesis protein NOC1 [Elsinoe australis]|uniref:Putative ribosome biogenesis protein NOC1 n=1 Tax=Elsinoe australis TaxID=40998 RepID=A0A4U7AYQ0_9PEZI|nr:putative ribosome biogenesis protein NOC1 [Elsinoe australis]